MSAPPSPNSISPWIEKTLEKVVMTLQNDVIKKKIQILVLEPFMSYMLERVFPYVLLLVVIFGIMIILCIGTLGYIVYSLTGKSSVADVLSNS